ncbi:Uncharacterised protein [Enterobacter asburiae]|uniref:Uncharacterized protein n=1 Tax=Enterobacter asburiae TaxID=61645 RepID=A0A376F7K9_ENTAS|nr:Uncharacterised protein [Enterobacter asburiae]
MADFCHAYGSLIRRGFPRHQLIFEVNFNHFAHQAIGSPAHGGDLLQDGQTGIARLQRALKGINLAPNAADASKNTFFYLRVNAAYALLIL